MFTFKSKKIAALAISCSLLLTACYPTGGQALSTEDNSIISKQIEKIVSGNEQLEVDAEIEKNIDELPKVNVKIMEWDEEKIKNIFLVGKNNLEHEERPAHYDEFFPNDKSNLYLEGDDYWFIYEPGRLSSEDRHSKAFGYKTLVANFKFFWFKDYFTDESISVLPKEEAINRCTNLMNEIGITNYSEPEIYAITVDKANKFWRDEEYDEYEEYGDWTSIDDEIYILRFSIKYNDIPVTTISPKMVEGDAVGLLVGSYIDFIVTKDKVYSFDSNNIFSPEYENGESVSIKCSAENALKIAADYYNGIKLEEGESVKITDCNLVYAPFEWHKENEAFILTPVWEISVAQYTGGKLMGIKTSMFIDVQTGDIIIW